MHFVPLDPKITQQLIKGYEDVLTPEAEKLDAFYKSCRCPHCGGECARENATGHAFADREFYGPRSILRCVQCKLLFDPHSGLILERADHVDIPY